MRHPHSMDSCMAVTFMRQPENFENVAHRREDAEEAAKQSPPPLQAPAAPTPVAAGDGRIKSAAQAPAGEHSSSAMLSLLSLRPNSRGSPSAEDVDTRWDIKMAALPQTDIPAARCRHEYMRKKEASLFEEFERVRESFAAISDHLQKIDLAAAVEEAGCAVANSVQSSLLLVLGCLGTLLSSISFLPGSFTFAADVRKLKVEHPDGRESAVVSLIRSSSCKNTGAEGNAAASDSPETRPSLDAGSKMQWEWLQRVQTKLAHFNSLLWEGSG